MNKLLLPSSAAVLLALLVAGCETDGGIAARDQEKSAVSGLIGEKRLPQRWTHS